MLGVHVVGEAGEGGVTRAHGVDALEADRADRVDGADRAAEARGPQRHGGTLLDLAGAARDRHRGHAHEHPRVEGGSHGGADVLEGAPVSVGDEDHGDIGSAAAEGLEDVADHLAGGVGGERVLGERRSEGHARTVSRREGAACRAPP